MSDFILDLTGLCVFVPRYDLETRPTRNQMRLLLADSEGACLPFPSPQSPPHIPVLLCNPDDVDRDPRFRQADRPMKGKEGKDWSVFYLYDQELVVQGAKKESLEVTMQPVSGCPKEGNETSFAWTGPLEQISPGSEKLRESCIFDDDPAVLGRVFLTQGKIKTLRISAGAADEDGKRPYWNWDFRVPEGGSTSGEPAKLKQALAGVVRYQFGLTGNALEITTRLFRYSKNADVLKAFKGGKKGLEQTIRLRSRGGDIEAWVKNLPWVDMEGGPGMPQKMLGPDYHFAHLYRLCENPDKVLPRVPHPLSLCQTGIPAAEPHHPDEECDPPRAAAHPRA